MYTSASVESVATREIADHIVGSMIDDEDMQSLPVTD